MVERLRGFRFRISCSAAATLVAQFGEQSAPCRPSSSRRLSRSISRLWSALWPLGENAGWSGGCCRPSRARRTRRACACPGRDVDGRPGAAPDTAPARRSSLALRPSRCSPPSWRLATRPASPRRSRCGGGDLRHPQPDYGRQRREAAPRAEADPRTDRYRHRRRASAVFSHPRLRPLWASRRLEDMERFPAHAARTQLACCRTAASAVPRVCEQST